LTEHSSLRVLVSACPAARCRQTQS